MSFPLDINQRWTLFLDRDGVINRRLVGAYVRSWAEFAFLPGVPAAVARLTEHFGRTVVVTNQQGIYKQLMTMDDLTDIHHQMKAALTAVGGTLDAVYACPHSDADDPDQCRKPRLGMAWQAKRDFPEIDFARSVMVGDSISDLQFGRRAGMATVFIAPEELPAPQASLYDLRISALPELLSWLPE
jgi:D-glycero-D-manno-heptose 1,7-bisphosphate phosphatase